MTCPDIHLRGPICGSALIWKHFQYIRGAYRYPLEQHVAWDFEDHDKEEHELVPKIYRGLGYSDICGEASCEGASQVHPVKLKDEQAQK